MSVRKTTIVAIWDCEVYDDEMKLGGKPEDGMHAVSNIAFYIDDLGDEESYSLKNVTVFEADGFGEAVAKAITKRKGPFK